MLEQTTRLLSRIQKSRGYQRILTALRILRQRGPIEFIIVLSNWLRGQRHHSEPPVKKNLLKNIPDYIHATIGEPNYKVLVTRTEPSPDQLRQQREQVNTWSNKPLLSIITPVYAPSLEIFKELFTSVMEQTYAHWEWIVADASPDEIIWDFLTTAAASDSRIHPVRIQQNKGISANTNIAIDAAQGEFIALVDHDDVIARHALFEVAHCIQKYPDADLIYSDEDKLNWQGRRSEPWFKPDWSPELMLSVNLITHLSVLRRSLVQEFGMLDPNTDGAQDWDLFLRVSEHTEAIYHIPKVLYHWRKTPNSTATSVANKPGVQATQRIVLKQHLDRIGLENVNVTHLMNDPITRVHPIVEWDPKQKRTISVIITVTHQATLDSLLFSLVNQTDYQDFNVIVIDQYHGGTLSIDPQFAQRSSIIDDDRSNIMRMRNVACENSTADLLLFLDENIEVIDSNWLKRMVQWFDLEGIGVVGAKLVSSRGRIHHAGLIAGLNGSVDRIFYDEFENTTTSFGPAEWYRNLSAVSSECLLIDCALFKQLNGYDERLTALDADLDLGLRVREAGYRILFTPHAVLRYKHRAKTMYTEQHGEPTNPRFADHVASGDPYFNPNLSYCYTRPRMALTADDT